MRWTRELVRELIRDLAAAELRHLRPSARLDARTLPDDFLEPSSTLALDSLEVFQIATQVAVFFELHATGLESRLLDGEGLEAWIDVVLESRARHDEALTFHTSGTTGQPKPVRQTLAHLAREADHWAWLFSDRTELAATVPRHHIYGFIWTVLLPERLGVPCRDDRGRLPQGVFPAFGDRGLLITLPEFLQAFVRTGVAPASDLCVVTSTGPCPLPWAEAGLAAGIDRLLHVYGSTETRGLAVRSDAEPDFVLLPFVERGDDGALRYRNADGTTEALEVQDDLAFSEARRFRLLGRRDAMVQVGGRNVSPELVGRKLRACPDVRDATVRPFDTGTGTRLKAFVVPRGERETAAAALDAFIREHLPPEERPVHVEFGTELPAPGPHAPVAPREVPPAAP
jgi:long-chain acyl-CoA synthetase